MIIQSSFGLLSSHVFTMACFILLQVFSAPSSVIIFIQLSTLDFQVSNFGEVSLEDGSIKIRNVGKLESLEGLKQCCVFRSLLLSTRKKLGRWIHATISELLNFLCTNDNFFIFPDFEILKICFQFRKYWIYLLKFSDNLIILIFIVCYNQIYKLCVLVDTLSVLYEKEIKRVLFDLTELLANFFKKHFTFV